jgi:positive regulator of sigma E activity
MECRGKVITSDGKKALLRVARVNCAECGACGLLARDKERIIEFTVADRLGVEPGDEVILQVPSRRLYAVYLTIFGLPLLAMAAAYLAITAFLGLISVAGWQGVVIIATVITGFVSFWAGIKLAERFGLSPVMLEKVQAGETGEGDEVVTVQCEEGGIAGAKRAQP